MTITLEIPPELEAELTRQAGASGMEIGAYVTSILEEAASSKEAPAAGTGNMVELFAPLRGLNLDFERNADPGRDVVL